MWVDAWRKRDDRGRIGAKEKGRERETYRVSQTYLPMNLLTGLNCFFVKEQREDIVCDGSLNYQFLNYVDIISLLIRSPVTYLQLPENLIDFSRLHVSYVLIETSSDG